MTAESFAWLVICIYFEARGEPMYAKVRVAHVVMNRAAERNLSVREVIQQPSQFSFYKGLKAGKLNVRIPKDVEAAELTFEECKELAEKASEKKKGKKK